jgi:hypothetical protein
MTNSTFKKLPPSEQPLYGPRRLILCGFDATARNDFEKLIRVAEIAELDCLWAGAQESAQELKALFDLPLEAVQKPDPAPHPRAIIAGGLMQKEFHLLMRLSREVDMPVTLWAVLTPISADWTLEALLKELSAERAAIMARKRSQAQ